MRLTFLGTGTSTGVPEIGCSCEVCTSTDTRDARLRSSVMLQESGANILIDCGPDFRAQMLRSHFNKIDALLLTHKHYDHTGGIDDLRPFSYARGIPVYAERETEIQVRSMYPYCFGQKKYPGVANITLHPINSLDTFMVAGVEVTPIRVFHGMYPILGYRFGRLAYITDMSYIEPVELEKLRGVDTLVINALRYSKPHRTHQTVLEALAVISEVKPRIAYFTHMMHHIGLHAKIEKCLPENVCMAYDGLVIDI